MQKQEIQIGEVIGRLRVVEAAGFKVSPNGTRRTAYRCVCECGNEVICTGTMLKAGTVKSCGCWRRDRASKLNYKHGGFGTRLYMCWVDMRRRCAGRDSTSGRNYKDRGISVCRSWDSWIRFRDWALSHGYAEGLTLDRIDNDKGYMPSNCRWATTAQQNNNQQRTTWVFMPEGKMSLADAVRRHRVVCYNTASARIRRGWDPVKAVLTERIPNKNRRKGKNGL